MADDPYGGVKYFEDVAKGRDARVAVNWSAHPFPFFLSFADSSWRRDRVLHELLGLLTKANLGLADSPVQAAQLGLIVDAVSDGRITGEFLSQAHLIAGANHREQERAESRSFATSSATPKDPRSRSSSPLSYPPLRRRTKS